MATNVYIKSLLWLVSLGGLGYTLMKLTEPSEAKLEEIRKSSPSTALTENERKKLIFLRKLKEASNETPIYLQKKEK